MKTKVELSEQDKVEMVADAVADLQQGGISRPSAQTIKQHIYDNHGVEMSREEVKQYRRQGTK